jgi:hypothetical protein
LQLFQSAALPSALHRPLQYLNHICTNYVPAAACAPLLMFVLPLAPFVFTSTHTHTPSSPDDSAAKSSLSSIVLEYWRYACGLRLLLCICFRPYEYIQKVSIDAGQSVLIHFDTQVSFMRLPYQTSRDLLFRAGALIWIVL